MADETEESEKRYVLIVSRRGKAFESLIESKTDFTFAVQSFRKNVISGWIVKLSGINLYRH